MKQSLTLVAITVGIFCVLWVIFWGLAPSPQPADAATPSPSGWRYSA